MGIRIGDIPGRFELMNWNEPDADRIRRRFLNHDEALRFLRMHLLSADVLAGVRRWGFDLGIHHRTNRGFLLALAAAIHSGEVWVAELERASARQGGGGGGGKPIPPEPEPNPNPGPSPNPRPTPTPVAELMVTVKNLFGKPVEGVTVTAGALGSKITDKNGIADFGQVTPGSYAITAAKTGHGKTRNGIEEKDEKKVSVPDGSKTAVDLIQHPECANVAFFEGSKTRATYFGFDHKTNIKAPPKTEYWVPVPDKGTLAMPASAAAQIAARDGARWVSVAVGKEAELEINFAFKDAECIPCLANSTYQVIPATVAEVVTAKITAKQAVFKIKGLAKGEASLKVVCDGQDIGWFYIWCEAEKDLMVDVATIVTTHAAAATYNLAALKLFLDNIYRQAAITMNLKDLGTIDLSANAVVAAAEAPGYLPGKKFLEGAPDAVITSSLAALDTEAMASVAARPTPPERGRAGARRLYFYVPTVGGGFNGMALDIGHPATMIFYDTAPAVYSTCAHEIGHSMKLRHPLHDSGAGQFAAHNLATLNAAVPAYAATNTEPASAAAAGQPNVMSHDPTNLMGYWDDRAARIYLRYHQWKAADRS